MEQKSKPQNSWDDKTLKVVTTPEFQLLVKDKQMAGSAVLVVELLKSIERQTGLSLDVIYDIVSLECHYVYKRYMGAGNE